ncbi:MAG TPA: hypothetical protein VJG32_03680 [Anaerolineae bacterium]|nr:hypothetical protein [Anaerolineae bacterium]
MNPFVIAGAVLLVVVIAGYTVITRREIAKLPPLEKKIEKQEKQKKRKKQPEAAAKEDAEKGRARNDAIGAATSGEVSEGERPQTEPPSSIA